jgi:hypothetical protein
MKPAAQETLLQMAIMLGQLHAALIAAGVPDDAARSAATEVAEFRNDIADLKSTLRLHTWILSTNTAGLLAVLFKLFH